MLLLLASPRGVGPVALDRVAKYGNKPRRTITRRCPDRALNVSRLGWRGRMEWRAWDGPLFRERRPPTSRVEMRGRAHRGLRPASTGSRTTRR